MQWKNWSAVQQKLSSSFLLLPFSSRSKTALLP
jgi:hypothetical protein